MNKSPRQRRLDAASTATILVTLVLFAASLFNRGLTHDALLEIAVFLVSVKLILSTHKTELLDAQTKVHLERIEAHLRALRGPDAESASRDPNELRDARPSGIPHQLPS